MRPGDLAFSASDIDATLVGSRHDLLFLLHLNPCPTFCHYSFDHATTATSQQELALELTLQKCIKKNNESVETKQCYLQKLLLLPANNAANMMV